MTGEFAIAVHALVFLNRRGETVNSETLADNVCTHPARLRGVMAKLKKAGLVDTKEGMEGGYAFRKDPAQVTLRQICDALNVKLVSASWRSGSVDKPCMISSGMADVMDDLYSQMDALGREYLSHITIADIDRQIFSGKEKGASA